MVAQLLRRQREIKLRDIEPGDRVLVEAGRALEWNKVRDVSGEWVSTEERPEGVRMDALVRHEKKVEVAA
jgi:hypothetical protein